MKYQLRRFLFSLIPKYNSTLYTICKRYVDHYNGENNSNMLANGEVDFITANAKNWNVVFDVGAHKGEWTQAVLAVHPTTQIHCFEPIPHTFELLSRNDFPSHVHLNQLALSVTTGTATMYVDGGSACNSLYDRQWTYDGSKENHNSSIVQTTTLDDYCFKHSINTIDMMKMDIEGAEMDVLKGAQEMLTQGKIHCIQFEYDRSYIDAKVWLRDMFVMLQPLGYEMKKVYPSKLKLYLQYDQRLENFHNSNWIAELKH
jgi:FkbM family methyltransferase